MASFLKFFWREKGSEYKLWSRRQILAILPQVNKEQSWHFQLNTVWKKREQGDKSLSLDVDYTSLMLLDILAKIIHSHNSFVLSRRLNKSFTHVCLLLCWTRLIFDWKNCVVENLTTLTKTLLGSRGGLSLQRGYNHRKRNKIKIFSSFKSSCLVLVILTKIKFGGGLCVAEMNCIATCQFENLGSEFWALLRTGWNL